MASDYYFVQPQFGYNELEWNKIKMATPWQRSMLHLQCQRCQVQRPAMREIFQSSPNCSWTCWESKSVRNLQICPLFVRQVKLMILINCVQSEDCANIVECVFCSHERDLAMRCRSFLFLSRSGPNAWENGCCACERETEPKCVSLMPNAWDLVGLFIKYLQVIAGLAWEKAISQSKRLFIHF